MNRHSFYFNVSFRKTEVKQICDYSSSIPNSYVISIVSVLSQIIDISVSITKAAGNHQQTLLNIALQFKKRVDNENRK